MSVLTGRDGQISVVRVGTIVAVIGVLLVVAAAVAFSECGVPRCS